MNWNEMNVNIIWMENVYSTEKLMIKCFDFWSIILMA